MQVEAKKESKIISGMVGSKPPKKKTKWIVHDIMQSLLFICSMKAIFMQLNLLCCAIAKSSNLIVLYNLVLLSRNIHEWRGRKELLSEGKEGGGGMERMGGGDVSELDNQNIS